jgi:hypothetical protein
MAQAVSRRPPTAEDRARSRVSPCGICRGESGSGTGFSSSNSVFPCQFHSTGAPGQGKTNIFNTELQNKTQGGGASVASAAGPFPTKEKKRVARAHYIRGCMSPTDNLHSMQKRKLSVQYVTRSLYRQKCTQLR